MEVRVPHCRLILVCTAQWYTCNIFYLFTIFRATTRLTSFHSGTFVLFDFKENILLLGGQSDPFTIIHWSWKFIHDILGQSEGSVMEDWVIMNETSFTLSDKTSFTLWENTFLSCKCEENIAGSHLRVSQSRPAAQQQCKHSLFVHTHPSKSHDAVTQKTQIEPVLGPLTRHIVHQTTGL